MTWTAGQSFIIRFVFITAACDLVDCNRGHFADHDTAQRVCQARVAVAHDELDYAVALLQSGALGKELASWVG